MSFKPIDSKRDESRRYLEHYGVIDTLTKALKNVLKERPDNAVEHLARNLGYARSQADNLAYLESELKDARNEINRLTDIIRNINPDLLHRISKKEAFEEVVNITNNDCIEGGDVQVEIVNETFNGVSICEKREHQSNTDIYIENNVDGITA